MNVYAEFTDLLVAGMTPEQLLTLNPSKEAQERVVTLVAALKNETITPDERAELNHHLEIDELVRLAKAKARQHGAY